MNERKKKFFACHSQIKIDEFFWRSLIKFLKFWTNHNNCWQQYFQTNFSWTWKKLKYCISMEESVKHVLCSFHHIIDQFWNGTQTMRHLKYLLLIRSGEWYESKQILIEICSNSKFSFKLRLVEVSKYFCLICFKFFKTF